MGIFVNYKQRSFLEVEIDGAPAEGSDNPPEDFTGGESPQEQPPAEPPASTEPPADDGGQSSEPATEEQPPMDFTNAPPPDDGGGAPPASSTPPPAEGESEVDDIKKREEELYSNLTPEQLDIMHKELKNQYLAMYDVVISVIERIGDAEVAEENIHIVEYVSNELSRLKDTLIDYVNSVYQTKSYTENSINYNRFLSVLNGLNKILEEMNSKNAQN